VEFLYSEGGEALAQVAQRSGCPILGVVGQVGWGPDPPDLVSISPAPRKALKLDGLSGPF